MQMLEQCSEQKESNPDTDGRISHIKRRPVIGADIKIEKVHHRSETQPVDQVSHRPAGYQPQGVDKNSTLAFQVPVGNDYDHQGHDGNRYKKGLAQPGFAAGQKSEGCPGICEVHQVKKPRDDRLLLMERKLHHYPELGQLVDNDHCQGDHDRNDIG